MTELILKSDIGKKKLERLLHFLKSWDMEVEIMPVTEKSEVRKIRVINKSRALSDEQLSEKLSDDVSDMSSCSENDCREIV
ncbi:MAG: hypothetical protein LBR08_03000 [Bacteroidales bacterium]|nr:hypothetical protein [Bacteroidales bacterium]